MVLASTKWFGVCIGSGSIVCCREVGDLLVAGVPFRRKSCDLTPPLACRSEPWAAT